MSAFPAHGRARPAKAPMPLANGCGPRWARAAHRCAPGTTAPLIVRPPAPAAGLPSDPVRASAPGPPRSPRPAPGSARHRPRPATASWHRAERPAGQRPERRPVLPSHWPEASRPAAPNGANAATTRRTRPVHCPLPSRWPPPWQSRRRPPHHPLRRRGFRECAHMPARRPAPCPPKPHR